MIKLRLRGELLLSEFYVLGRSYHSRNNKINTKFSFFVAVTKGFDNIRFGETFKNKNQRYQSCWNHGYDAERLMMENYWNIIYF